MALETGTYISDLVTANPTSSDPKSQGDDHIRLLKSTVKATFPNVTGAVTATQVQLNYVTGVTSAIQTQIDAKVTSGGALGTPTSGTLTNCSGTATNLTSGITNALKSATTTVNVSSATAPTAGQVLTASSGTAATWVTPSIALNTISAATGASTIGNGVHDIVWNWGLTGASDVGFTIGETSAATGGSGSQDLFKITTTSASTANPLRVQTRGVDTILVTRTGAVSVTAPALATGAGNNVTITAGTGASSSAGGAVNVTAAATVSNIGGAVNITSGACTSGLGDGGLITIQGGDSASNQGGSVLIRGGLGNSSQGGGVTIQGRSQPAANGGPVVIQGGDTVNNGAVGTGTVSITSGNNTGTTSTGADIILTTGTGTSANGKINFVNCNVANGTVATTITSLGPTGAATTIQGWLAIKVGGTARYIPYW